MSRRKKGARVLGPYSHSSGHYRIALRSPHAPDEWFYFGSRAKAERAKEALEAGLAIRGSVTMETAADEYGEHLISIGDQKSTADQARSKLAPLVRLVGADAPVSSMSSEDLQTRLRELPSVAARKNTLSRIRHFCAWLMGQKYISKDPSAGIVVVGQVKRGKPQLTRAEARVLDDLLWKTINEGKDKDAEKALAVLLLLYSGMREGELLRLQVRDIDLAAVPVVISIERRAKTRTSFRDFEIPEQVAVLLRKRVTGKSLNDWLWPSWRDSGSGHFEKYWLIQAVKKMCRLAGVSEITPQGLRGTHARLAREAGVTSHVIAAQLGHASTGVTVSAYVGEEADEKAKGRKAFQVIQGGES